MKASLIPAVLVSILSYSIVPASAQSLPVVDLLTSRHQAIENATGGFYTFKNIPYAEPPVGQLRFRAPVPRLTIDRTIDDGSNGRICPQAGGPWFQYSVPLVIGTIMQTCNNTNGAEPGAPSTPDIPLSEDCLLLDVTVPKSVWNGRSSTKRPVLVWIHGGGYIEGSKETVAVPELVSKSLADDKGGMIVITLNYRLGLFGFPPRNPWMWDVASNAGLYDQRLALEWIRFNIKKFGGDSTKITVIGESAGGGSIMAHLSAFGGIKGITPFQRAIIQSPAMKPAVNAARYSQLYSQLLSTASIASYSDARALSTEQLQGINAAMVGQAAFADTVFGPNVDGLFILDEPIRLVSQGKVDSAVKIIVSHATHEGLLFTDPRVSDESGFKSFFKGLIPNIPSAKIDTIASSIYPPDFSGAQPYTTMTERLALAVAEAVLDCNAYAISLGYENNTRGYLFGICPGMHAQDEKYMFFNGDSADSLGLLIDEPTANTMQNWIVDFTIKGDASGSAATQLPLYGSGASVSLVDGTTAFPTVRDTAANPRCQFWSKGF